MAKARKLTPEELASAEETPSEGKAPAEAPASVSRKLTPEELAGAAETKPEEPGFFDTIAQGAKNLAVSGGELLAHPIDTLTNPSKRREIERGLSDTITAGYAQKLGEFVDRTMNEEFPSISARHMAPKQVQQDAENAPGFRTLGSAAGMFAPNPFGNVVGAAGDVGGAVAQRVAPKLVAKGLGYVSKVPAMARDVVGGLAGYEVAAPLAAAAAAAGEEPQPGGPGRWEAAKGAAKRAAVDPVGLALTVGGAAAGGAFKRGVLGSKGAKARALIDSERSGGAHAGLFTAGEGGVFADELAGLGTDDAATGRAAQIGAKGIVPYIEGQHAAEHGYDYREGPDLVKKASADRAEAIRRGETEASAAGRDAKAEIRDANLEARQHAHDTAPELIAKINEDHHIEASEPYRVLKEQIDNSPASRQTRDVSELLAQLHEAKYDFETDNAVRPLIGEYIDMLERYRDRNSGIVNVPERQLNGLRRNLMGAAKIGMTDAPAAREAPLRKAAFLTKEMVDQGPYAALNSLYAEGSAAREAAREALGLPARLGRNQAIEESTLKARMIRSVKDPTAFPGEGPPPEADMGPYRQRIQEAEASRLAAEEAARTSKAEALAHEAATKERVAKGTQAAIPDRQLLGLNEDIGQRAIDENQVGIALERQVGTGLAAGRNKANWPAFREKHPSQARNVDLPVLQKARNDLSFRLKRGHGGLAVQAASDIAPIAGLALLATKHPWPAALLAAGKNKDFVNGRLLYTPAKALKVQNIARALGAARGADLGQKAEAYIELQKGQGQ